jgi:hypothetical protein
MVMRRVLRSVAKTAHTRISGKFTAFQGVLPTGTSATRRIAVLRNGAIAGPTALMFRFFLGSWH